METDVPSCPIDIYPLDTEAVMLITYGATKLIEQFLLSFWQRIENDVFRVYLKRHMLSVKTTVMCHGAECESQPE
jgi:hypothetical protein